MGIKWIADLRSHEWGLGMGKAWGAQFVLWDCGGGLRSWPVVWNSGKSSISIFEQFFASVDKIFILGVGGLGAGL